mgnify:FL=1
MYEPVSMNFVNASTTAKRQITASGIVLIAGVIDLTPSGGLTAPAIPGASQRH